LRALKERVRERRKRRRECTMFVCPSIPKAPLRRSGHLKTKGAFVFVNGNNESCDHADEDVSIDKAALLPHHPRKVIVDITDLFKCISMSEPSFNLHCGFWKKKERDEVRSEHGNNKSKMIELICSIINVLNPSIGVINVRGL